VQLDQLDPTRAARLADPLDSAEIGRHRSTGTDPMHRGLTQVRAQPDLLKTKTTAPLEIPKTSRQ
jgi:hypothetical protein